MRLMYRYREPGRARVPLVPLERSPKTAASAAGGHGSSLKSRKRGAIPIRRTIGREFSGDRVLVNIISVVSEVVWIANPMIGESSLPHFGVSSANSAERVRVSAFD